MRPHATRSIFAIATIALGLNATPLHAASDDPDDSRRSRQLSVQLGPRPLFLVNDMADSRLKSRLLSCEDRRVTPREFSIGHRGAALQFPEHTRESYEAGARMGAGILECDVTFAARQNWTTLARKK
jgi:glycerophosphoryl diester phosphodiesterase